MPQRNPTIVTGQVAATETELTAGPSDDIQRVNVQFSNVGVTEETLVVTIAHSGGTSKRIARAVLNANEFAVLGGLPLNSNDSLLASTTNAATVDYHVTRASDESPLTWTVYDANGAVKQITNLASAADLGDGVNLTFGDDNDLTLEFNSTDNVVTNGPVTGLWAGAPSLLDPDPSKFHFLYEDFNKGMAATTVLGFSAVNDGGTGTNAYADIAGGVYNIVTAAADNDYHAIASLGEHWLFLAGKKLWFEARFKLTEANTNESAWWFGLTDTLTTGGFQADAAGPLASYDGALIWKDEATMTVDFETSNAGTQATTSAIATFVTNTWTKVGFYFNGAATTGVITPYVDIGGGWVVGTAQNITLSGLEEVHLVAGVKAGPTAGAETLQIDYLKIMQLR